MRKSDSKALTLSTVLLIMLSAGQLPATVNAAPQTGRRSKAVRCPDEAPTTGQYKNYTYDFAVTIPRGLKGFWNSARCVKEEKFCVCMGDHGRYIPLRAGAYLEVVANYPNEETRDEEFDQQRKFLIRHHKDRGEEVELLSQTKGDINRVPATRLEFRYKDRETGRPMIEAIIICLRESRGEVWAVYTVTLATPESAYTANELFLERLLRSWRFGLAE